MAIDRAELVDILDQAYNIVAESKGGHITDRSVIITTPVYAALVGYLINQKENKSIQLNG